MEYEKDKEYGLQIFCVFFQNYNVEESMKTLEQIAELGKTKILRADSLDSLYTVFNNISDKIQKTFVLKSEIKKE